MWREGERQGGGDRPVLIIFENKMGLFLRLRTM